MEKYSEVIGLPVICGYDGRKLGTVKDVVFCIGEKKVLAFLLETRGYKIGKKVIFVGDVLSLGRDALIIGNAKDMQNIRKVKDRPEFKNKIDILGVRVYTRSGDEIGTVKDILIDFNLGRMDGVEISDGLVKDIYEGRNILPLIGKTEFGEESILVDNESVEEMVGTGGGIRNILVGRKKC
ncbi:MAG: photosystem reaction center subunit H [Clostridium sp.]|nr:photosystem reaction center subunit H [Clostridium sp.]